MSEKLNKVLDKGIYNDVEGWDQFSPVVGHFRVRNSWNGGEFLTDELRMREQPLTSAGEGSDEATNGE
jgi:hypothetical protein